MNYASQLKLTFAIRIVCFSFLVGISSFLAGCNHTISFNGTGSLLETPPSTIQK